MRGWILDLYPESPGRMVVWMKLESGETRRLVDRWAPSIFVASDSRADLADLEKGRGRDFSWSRRVMKLERATDRSESEVVELVVDDAKKLAPLAESVERSRPFGTYRLYNVDVPTEQMYLYEKDLFPLACCEVSETPDGLRWDIQDDIWSCQYEVPELRSVELDVRISKSGKMAKVSDPIESIGLKTGDGSVSKIEGGSEEGKILGLVEEVKRLDPDLVFTSGGDAFVLPYLVARAAANGVADKLRMDRDGGVLESPAKKGTSYFSYGKILFKPSAMKLPGRIHLDTNSSFVHRETGLEGFYEVSRVCRLPLHTASRASIGKALSSLQFYYATKDNMLIPWKPVLAESFKSRAELLVADRGGFVFEPETGLHEGIGELDFSSLYPSIMLKKNISAETVRCSCCPDSANRIPELDWNVCERRPEGIVPKAAKIIVEKRTEYKRLEQVTEGEERERYQARRNALKWVGVACLPRESPVFVRSGGKDRFVQIGDFIDGLVGDRVGVIECPPGVFVAGVGHDYKAKHCKVARLIKKPNSQKLLSFVMEDGRKIVTTPDHLFFTLREGRLEVRAAEELETGDIVPTARKIPSSGSPVQQVDLIGRLGSLLSNEEQQLWRVSGDRLKEEIEAKRRIPIIFNCRDQVAHRSAAGLVAGDGHTAKHRRFVSVATASKDFQNQIGFLAAKLGLAFRLGTNREGNQSLYTVNFVGPETLGRIADWEYSKEGQRAKILTWADESSSGTCDHARYERLPIGESGLFALAKTTRTSSEPHAREEFRTHPVQVKKKISRIASEKLDENHTRQVGGVEKLLNSDLGFVRIRRIERLDTCPEYVYCFQLEEDEVPGFFTGEGLTFTHNCFGYLGFNNAKFGRIDAHIGVCAWDRKVILDAARVAERRGFRVIHGIVDSLWLKKEGAGEEDYQRLRREIEVETGFEISFEGIYKWIAFPPSKASSALPVLNRYFGAYRDGELKVRGIEARRHDTPPLFTKCQMEILGLLSRADTVEEAAAMVDDCVGVFLRHARSLLDHEVAMEELVFTRNLSKKPGEYVNRSLTSSVSEQLVQEGVDMHAGETVRYVITEYGKSAGERAVAFDLVDDKTTYDARRYVELLAEACSTVLEPFRAGCCAQGLVRIAERELLHSSLSAEQADLRSAFT